MRAKWLRRLAALVLIVALVLLSWGMYIPAKAQLAQWLLRSAWQQSLHTREPVKPWAWADTWPVARLQAPAHDIDQIVLAGDSGAVLAFGPGLNGATVAPGEAGNSVISAHRDTHFRFLRHVESGDRFHIQTRHGQRMTFEVLRTEVMDTRHARLHTGDNSGSFVTLVTCYPFEAVSPNGPLRYVVIARRRTVSHSTDSPAHRTQMTR